MLVREYRPDLIILDVMLPDINGRDVCVFVRNDKSLEAVKIICVSGEVEEDKIDELIKAGANEFLPKPFDTDKLIEHVCRLLEVEANYGGSRY